MAAAALEPVSCAGEGGGAGGEVALYVTARARVGHLGCTATHVGLVGRGNEVGEGFPRARCGGGDFAERLAPRHLLHVKNGKWYISTFKFGKKTTPPPAATGEAVAAPLSDWGARGGHRGTPATPMASHKSKAQLAVSSLFQRRTARAAQIRKLTVAVSPAARSSCSRRSASCTPPRTRTCSPPLACVLLLLPPCAPALSHLAAPPPQLCLARPPTPPSLAE